MQTPSKSEAPTGFAGFIAKFLVLRGALRELWLIFATKLLTLLAYGVMNFTLVLWLSSDLGYSDIGAGNVYAAWSVTMTLCTVAVGSLVDAIGLRKAFLLGVGICVLSRGMMTFATTPMLALAGGLFPLALGEALMTPVMVAAVRRYATTSQRSISYSLFYAMMNAGLGVASLVFDWVRRGLGEHGHFTLPVAGITLSTYRTLFLLSFLLTLPSLLILYFGVREGAAAADYTEAEGGSGKASPGSAPRGFFAAMKHSLLDAGRIFAGLWRQSAFHKFLIFLSLVVAVRLIVYHMYNTYPKFGIRELGDGAPIGRLWSLNGFLIVFLVPIVGALTQRISAYRMVIVGSSISAASVFLMALPTHWFEPLAQGALGHWVGHLWLGVRGPVHPYYLMILFYVLLLSLGEALWSPRLYEYSAAIAPKGQEASYMSMSYLPFFVAKLFVGMFSGMLLARYCPETGPRHSETLWLIIALTTLITPIGLLALRRHIQVHEAGRE
jgi:MFS family permease